MPRPSALSYLPEALRERFTEPRLLGQGAFGVVLEVRDLQLDRPVALKILDPHDRVKSEGAEILEARFQREAKLASQLSSPHVVRVFDSGVADGHHYLVSELVDATDLNEYVKSHQGGLSMEEALRIIEEVLTGLAAAHERDVIHRDLKPANVLMDRSGVAKIADFGLAREIEGGTLTKTGALIGTPAYIAPEQLDGRNAEKVGDVYAAGVLLYFLFMGRSPFHEARSPGQLWTMKREMIESDFGAARVAIPEAIRKLTTLLMHPDPEVRPPDAAAALEALQRAKAGQVPALPEGSHPLTGSDTVVSPRVSASLSAAVPAPASRRRPLLLGGLGVLAVLAGVFLASRGEEAPRLPTQPVERSLPLDEIETTLDQVERHPDVVKALSITGDWKRADGVDAWTGGRFVVRKRIGALLGALDRLDTTRGNPRHFSLSRRLMRLVDLFDYHALEDVPPLFRPGRVPPTDHLLDSVLRVSRWEALPGNIEDERNTRKAFLAAEEGTRKWALIRDVKSYQRMQRGKLVHENGVKIRNPAGVVFVDPRLVHSDQARKIQGADLLADTLRDGTSHSFENYPEVIHLPLQPFEGDLVLALDVERWEHAVVLDLEVSGPDGSLGMTVRRPEQRRGMPYRGGLLLRVHRKHLPGSPQDVHLRGYGLQPVCTPHQVGRIMEVFQLLEGPVPEGVSGSWPTP